jgi:hypothetical protein
LQTLQYFTKSGLPDGVRFSVRVDFFEIVSHGHFGAGNHARLSGAYNFCRRSVSKKSNDLSVLVWHVDDSLAFKNGGEKLSNDHDLYVCTTMLIFRLATLVYFLPSRLIFRRCTPALAPAAPRGAAGQR